MAGRRIFALTTKGSRNYADAEFKADDVLLFGSETAGLPQNIRDDLGVEHCLKVPMIGTSRSLNLSNTVALVSYEAWRQVGFLGSS